MANSTLYVRMAAGQLDQGQGLELGVVVNEASGGNGLAKHGVADRADERERRGEGLFEREAVSYALAARDRGALG
jgi:hypothetical protein